MFYTSLQNMLMKLFVQNSGFESHCFSKRKRFITLAIFVL